jgi:hypothetical protein
MTSTSSPQPLVCDMTNAPDSMDERMAEWGRLFEHALAGRERTEGAVIWRFTARAGVEEWARDLAAREAACCGFLTYTVTVKDGQVVYRIDGDSDPMVQAALDELHDVPDHIAAGIPGMWDRLNRAGFEIRTSGTVTAATPRG